MQTFDKIVGILLQIFSIFTVYKVFYVILGFFSKAKPLPPVNENLRGTRNYAVVICARNEEKVIANLIDSIKKQTYPQDKTTVFVCADNCTDNTAELCRSLGCTVYERHEPKKARKGYALGFLFENIKRDYGIETFDGYFFFDADNLLKENFIETMDRVFDRETSDVIVGYRNTKNFDTNIISSAYGIHFYRSTMSYHRPRNRLGLNTHIAGTGYLINSKHLKDGWKHAGLTEDAEFTQQLTGDGGKIEFCEQAEFFDEQPCNFFVAWRQRMRWSKGRLIAFFKNAGRLVKGLFTNKGFQRKFSCYDIFFYNLPNALLTAFLTAIYPATNIVIAIVSGSFFSTLNLPHLLVLALTALGSTWFTSTLIGALVCIRERRHIHCPTGKLVFYVITWFWFGLVSLPVSVCALFVHVKWKPIKHSDQTNIDDLKQSEVQIAPDNH